MLAAYLGAWLLTSGLVAVAVAGVLHFYGDRLIHHSIVELTTYIGKSLKFNDQGHPASVPLPKERAWVVSALSQDVGYRIFNDRAEVLLWSSPETQQAWISAGLKAEPVESDGSLLVNGIHMQFRTVAIEGAREHLWVQAVVSDRLIELAHIGSSNRLAFVALLTAVASILLLGGVLVYVLRQVLKPVKRLSQEAREIDLAKLDRRLSLNGVPSELRPLVASFNQALSRLEQGYADQRRFLADTAHELKTPLALLRGQLELDGVSDATQLIRDVDHIARQVQQLLVLAEVSELRNYINESVNVRQVAMEVVDYLEPLAGRKGVQIEMQVGEDSPVLDCDRSALFVLLKNLVENAVSYAPRATAVTLSVGNNSVRVRDQGVGIAPGHLAHLFERFWRGPERQEDGAGLGLAICHEISQAHGWQLEVQNAEPGAEFSLNFGSSLLHKE
ncbi:MAG: hypothetical protein A2503_04055 [Burkholderiales bacterium RIFOXYD12_FULL_59_19]|nr:MAG: hypothetical protein A2503_04055 [Burkholderiales bacterium RIFOXYD12_FULL_59_19]